MPEDSLIKKNNRGYAREYFTCTNIFSPFIIFLVGGVTAMHDAIALANLLYALPSSTSADITKIFEEYKKERHPVVMTSYKDAHLASKMDGRGFFGALIVSMVTNIPRWLWIKAV